MVCYAFYQETRDFTKTWRSPSVESGQLSFNRIGDYEASSFLQVIYPFLKLKLIIEKIK